MKIEKTTEGAVILNGKEVTNPFLRFLSKVGICFIALFFCAVAVLPFLILLILAAVGTTIVGASGALGVVLAAAVVVAPHALLRLLGRRGFIEKTCDPAKDETTWIVLSFREAFERKKEA